MKWTLTPIGTRAKCEYGGYEFYLTVAVAGKGAVNILVETTCPLKGVLSVRTNFRTFLNRSFTYEHETEEDPDFYESEIEISDNKVFFTLLAVNDNFRGYTHAEFSISNVVWTCEPVKMDL